MRGVVRTSLLICVCFLAIELARGHTSESTPPRSVQEHERSNVLYGHSHLHNNSQSRSTVREKNGGSRDIASSKRIRSIATGLMAGVFILLVLTIWYCGGKDPRRSEGDSGPLESIEVHAVALGKTEWKDKLMGGLLVSAIETVQKEDKIRGRVAVNMGPCNVQEERVKRAISEAQIQKVQPVDVDNPKKSRRCFSWF